MLSSSASDRGWSVAPLVLRVLAEAGWITVAYAAASVVGAGARPILGPFELAAILGGGLLLAHFARRSPGLGPVLLVAGIIAGGALGWLAAPAVREAIVVDVDSALRLHPAGWLGGLAVLRGATMIDMRRAASQLEALLGWALPGVAVLWAIAITLAPPSLHGPFTATALWGSVGLIAAGVISLGLSRIEQLRIGATPTRRRLRQLVIATGLVVPPLALPVGLLSGLPVAEIFGPIVGPVRLLIGVVAVFMGLLAEAIVNFLLGFTDPSAEMIDGLQGASDALAGEELTGSPLLLTVIGVLLTTAMLVLLAVTVYLLARWLLGRRPVDDDDELPAGGRLERSIVVPGPARAATGRPGRPPRLSPPVDAAGAYVHALLELGQHPEYARGPSETPGLHVARLRPGGMPAATELARLAADYQLARYGGRTLPLREDRRALDRLSRLRRLLRRAG